MITKNVSPYGFFFCNRLLKFPQALGTHAEPTKLDLCGHKRIKTKPEILCVPQELSVLVQQPFNLPANSRRIRQTKQETG